MYIKINIFIFFYPARAFAGSETHGKPNMFYRIVHFWFSTEIQILAVFNYFETLV